METIEDKTLEIERLQEENAHFAWRDADKSKLITELCDALEFGYDQSFQGLISVNDRKLLQRARKATK